MSHNRMLQRIRSEVLLLLLFLQPAAAQLRGLHEEWRWAHFGVQAGLPSLQILNVVDIPSGIPWVLTREGIAWYDGFWWQRVPVDSAGPSEFSRATIAPSQTGIVLVIPPRIFHVTTSGAIELTPASNGTRLAVERAFVMADDAIMLQTDTALYVQKGGTATLLPSPFQSEMVKVPETQFGLLQSTDGTIWLTAPQGLYRWGDHGWQLWVGPSEREFVVAHSVIQNARGDGVLSARLGASQVRMEWQSHKVFARVTADPPTAMTGGDVAPDGSVVAQQMSGVLDLRSNGQWETVTSPPPQMLDAHVFRFRANGDLWIGTDRGLYLCALSSRRWRILEEEFSPGSKAINEILVAPDSTMWLGTSDGIIVYDRMHHARWISRVGGRRLGIVTGLANDCEGNIWATSGASFEGAYRWDGSTWKHFGPAQGFTGARVHRIFRDRNRRLWFLTIGVYPPGARPELETGAFVLERGTFRNYGVKDGLLDNRLYGFAEDSTGAWWFGSLKGLSRYKNGNWTHWTHRDGMLSNKVFTVAVDRSGRVWFGHQFAGMGYISEDDKVRLVTHAEGMTSRTVWNIVPAQDGKVWVATRDGLFVYSAGRWATFGSREGLPTPYLWPIWVTPGKAYLGTAGAGIAVLNYSEFDSPAPHVRFEPPIVQGEAATIAWHVASPWSHIAAASVGVRYRVDDRPWSEWSEVRSTTLTDLSTGAHTLAVEAKGPIGQVSGTPETIAFDIPPPLLLRPAFYLPVLVLLTAVASLLVVASRRRRQYDQALREQDARFRAVVEHQTEFILRLLPDGRISFVNEAFCRLTGRQRESLVGQHFGAILAGDGAEEPVEKLVRLAQQVGEVEDDRLFHLPDRGTRWIRWSSSPIRDAGGTVAELQMIGRDITDRKAAEELLVRSEERYRIVAEQTGQIIYDADLVAQRIAWLGAIEAVTGYTSEEFNAMDRDHWRAMVHDEDRPLTDAEYARCLATGTRFEMRYRIRHKNGSYINVLSNGIPLKDAAGKPVRMMGTILDITERLRSESMIAASLKEKEVLLKEIHHRVKNNLQIISSLLNLQAANITDPETIEELRESQNRIRSMALIHERLYQSDNLARIDFGEYVRGLVAYLARSYGSPAVHITIDVQRIDLAVNAAIPCGLIINELVSNALKYAFPGGRSGIVTVRLAVHASRTGILTVQDDGVGLPPDIDVEHTTTLGLQLVNTLTRQLNGSLALTRGGGTSFSLSFPVEV